MKVKDLVSMLSEQDQEGDVDFGVFTLSGGVYVADYDRVEIFNSQQYNGVCPLVRIHVLLH